MRFLNLNTLKRHRRKTRERKERGSVFILKNNESLEIARKLVQSTGLGESLDLLKEKNYTAGIEPRELLKQILGLSTCNLVRTMQVDFIAEEIVGEDRQDI